MSLLHPLETLTEEGLCHACDDAQWFEGAPHNCRDAEACACLTCHPQVLDGAVAIFDALDQLLALGPQVPRPRTEPRRNRLTTRG